MLSTLLVLSIILVGFSIAAIAIKILFKKNGEFKKSCSTMEASGGRSVHCTCSGKTDESCENYFDHHVRKKDPLEE